MMVQPYIPGVDDGEIEVWHNDGSWYLYGTDDGEDVREVWIETDLIVYTEDYR